MVYDDIVNCNVYKALYESTILKFHAFDFTSRKNEIRKKEKMKDTYASNLSHFWIQTATGNKFYVDDPKVEDVDARDIVHALPKICRYAGHCKGFYSVAEHSVIVADEVMVRFKNFELARAALLHDAPEAYLTDLPSPIKRLCPDYQALEGKVGTILEKKFDLKYPLDDDRIRQVDFEVFLAEKDQIMPEPWEVPGHPAKVKIRCLDPKKARDYFYEAMLDYKLM